MNEIKKVVGSAVAIRGDDIDTDRIIPARFLKELTFERMGNYAFYDERYDEGEMTDHPFNDERYKAASVLVVNSNFGCGSSREHAPQALKRWGIRAIVGESFAEIFAGNCTMLGIPTMMLPKEQVEKIMDAAEEDQGMELLLDIESSKIRYAEKEIAADMIPSAQKALCEGSWDSTSLLLESMEKIRGMDIPYLGWKVRG